MIRPAIFSNVRQPIELRPGEFQSFLTAVYAAAKIQDERRPIEPPRRA